MIAGGAGVNGSGTGNDYFDGGTGNNTLDYHEATNTLTVDMRTADRSSGAHIVDAAVLAVAGLAASAPVGIAYGADIGVDGFLNFQNLLAGTGNDTITANDADNYIYGDAGNDTVIAGGAGVNGSGTGNDYFDGGTGNNTLDYHEATNTLTVDMRTADRSTGAHIVDATVLAVAGLAASDPVGIAYGADIGTDGFLNFQNLLAGTGNDTITANDADNYIYGDAGNDTVIAGGAGVNGSGTGNDYFDGGTGNNTLDYHEATNTLTVDMRTADRSSGAHIVDAAVLAVAGLAASDPVGIAYGADIGVDGFLNFQNLLAGTGNDRSPPTTPTTTSSATPATTR